MTYLACPVLWIIELPLPTLVHSDGSESYRRQAYWFLALAHRNIGGHFGFGTVSGHGTAEAEHGHENQRRLWFRANCIANMTATTGGCNESPVLSYLSACQAVCVIPNG